MEDFCPVPNQSAFVSIELNIVIMMMMTMMVIINDNFIIAVIDKNAFLPSWSFSPSHESLYCTCYYTPVNQPEANKEQAENKAKRVASGDQSAMILEQKKKKKVKSLNKGVVVSFGWRWSRVVDNEAVGPIAGLCRLRDPESTNCSSVFECASFVLLSRRRPARSS